MISPRHEPLACGCQPKHDEKEHGQHCTPDYVHSFSDSTGCKGEDAGIDAGVLARLRAISASTRARATAGKRFLQRGEQVN
jgi:hypothetical protein